MRTRLSVASANRSSSLASSTLRAVGNDASSSLQRSWATTSTPSGSASAAHSSGVPNATLSRASSSAIDTASSSSVPA